MIAIRHNKPKTVKQQVDRHRNMVILAEGNSDYKINEICYYDNLDIVTQLYGESKLSRSFAIAKKIGVKHIFLVNVKRNTDYGLIANYLKHYDFTYIVPLGINFSDTFYNSDLNRPMYYSEIFLETIGQNTSSIVLMKDQHASLYEDMDHFLGDMSQKIQEFKNVSVKALRNGRSLGLVANHLKDYEEANLILASLLCVTELNQYPQYNFGEAVFDIDTFDVNSDLIYFKNNNLTNTSVENLRNFQLNLDASKIINIDRVIRYIERELDFSSFKGKPFTPYTKMALYRQLGEFLDGLMSTAIRGYKIDSIEFSKTSAGAGTIINSFTILPVNSTEEFDIVMEV